MSFWRGGRKVQETPKQKEPHVLHVLRASNNSERTADFGSIRFSGSRRPMPSKYARMAQSTAATPQSFERVIPLLTDTWGLAPPCALISILGEFGANPNDIFQTREHLVFARGLADAAVRMNAWVLTDGLAEGVASLAGRALRETEVPLIGLAPWSAVAFHEELEARPNGQVYVYGTGAKAHVGATGEAQKALEPNHTHFIMVDDGDDQTPDDEWPVRSALQKYLCDNDLSGADRLVAAGSTHAPARPTVLA